ncbi:MAG: MotA/TolQ/ExbB proton channel family protein [Lentisphaerae bacterium]|nr:MotA/TolQ/ExbB proton channel family protein [Lentisphaerota bacterium]
MAGDCWNRSNRRRVVMLEIIIKGGSMMVPLVAESVLALGIALDRWLAFRRDAKIDVRTLRAKVLRLLGEGRLAEAADLCASTPGPVSAVLLAGIQAYARHSKVTQRAETLRPLVEDALEDYAFTAMRAVGIRMNVLSFIGTSAPLFGMTGTVTGMIKSFNAIAGAGALEGGIVAAGIAEALITTAAGLLIAMGAVIPYH